MKISLICGTLNGSESIPSLLDSLVNQEYKNFEIIFVDQSKDNKTKTVLSRYEKKINIIYLHTSKKGLSHARNIGLAYATGDILGFPDDNCSYIEDSLIKVVRSFSDNKKLSCLIGKCHNQSGFIYNKKRAISTFNFFNLANSNTIFVKKRNLEFNEDFGVGAKYFSSEDAIYVLNIILEKGLCIYDPKLIVFHEVPHISLIENDKIKKYSFGAGRFFRLYFSYTGVKYQFFLALIYHTFKLFKELLFLNLNTVSCRFNLIKYRVKGFYFKEFRNCS